MSGCGMILHEFLAATYCKETFSSSPGALLFAGLYSHCVMDYARLEFGGEEEEVALMHGPPMTTLKHCACLHQCGGRGLFMD